MDETMVSYANGRRQHRRRKRLQVQLVSIAIVVGSTISMMLMMMRGTRTTTVRLSYRWLSSPSSPTSASSNAVVEAFNLLKVTTRIFHKTHHQYHFHTTSAQDYGDWIRRQRGISMRSLSLSSSSSSSEVLSGQQENQQQRGRTDENDDAGGHLGTSVSPLDLTSMIPGSNDGFYVVKVYETDPTKDFDLETIEKLLLADDNIIDNNNDNDDSDFSGTESCDDNRNTDIPTGTPSNSKKKDELQRLGLTSRNISVPIALMMLDPDEYPSRSKARKACRKANIMIHRGPLLDVDVNVVDHTDEDDDASSTASSSSLDDDDDDDHWRPGDEEEGYIGQDLTASFLASLGSSSVLPPNKSFDIKRCFRARVGDRIHPGDVVAKQIRVGEGSFPVMNHQRPPFDLPVVYEDDYFAIVNKPAGVVVYAQRKGGHGIMTVRAALPFAIRPSTPGTLWTLRRPQPVHRLDKPTSGLLIVAKTKPAMVHLSHQFRDRKVKKTYTAVVNGIPQEPFETSITTQDAFRLGVDVVTATTSTATAIADGVSTDNHKWQIIDHALDEKSAVTVWRTLRYSRSLKAQDNHLTLVELKPKTGRYHQLRRHLAWVCERPIVGDKEYDDGDESAMSFRDRGLFLCSNRVTLEHPHYNDAIKDRDERHRFFLENLDAKSDHQSSYNVWWSEEDGKIMVTASIPLPDKFESFLDHEEERYDRFQPGKDNQ